MQIIRKPSTDYIAEATPKSLIVLHYTAGGTLSGAESTLAIRDYVNVHYCIDREGKVYQYFDEKYWAYHTGTGLADAKRSIGIECVCDGHLTRKLNRLYTWYGKIVSWKEVVRCKPFRGFTYWHCLTQAQETAVSQLIEDIKTRHPEIRVTTHANLKVTKLDFPPDYPFISGLVTK